MQTKVKSTRSLLLCTIAIMFMAIHTAMADQVAIAITDLSGKGVSGMEASIVSDFLREAIVNTGSFRLVERSSMEQILSEQKFQLSGCTSDECAIQMGKLLNVQAVVVGSVSKFGERFYISVRMVDVEKGIVSLADTVNTDNMEGIQPACVALANRMATGKTGAPTAYRSKRKESVIKDEAKVIIKSRPTEADIYINGELRGKTPSKLVLPYGKYKIKVIKDKKEYKKALTIKTRIPKRIVAVLKIPPTELDITSVPDNAVVFIDRKQKGRTPYKKKLAPGEYRIAVAKRGYKTHVEEALKLESNQKKKLEISLKKKGEEKAPEKSRPEKIPKKRKPPVEKISKLGIGFYYPGICLRLFTNAFSIEARGTSIDEITTYGGRIYLTLNPRSEGSYVLLGGEYSNISGKTEYQEYTGIATGGFIGLELFAGKTFSVLMDIGPYNVNLKSDYKGIEVSDYYTISNIGINIYF